MTHSSIHDVTAETQRLRAALVGPSGSDLTPQILALEAAAGRLSKLEQEWRTAPPKDLDVRARAFADLTALRQEVRALDPLVRHGEEFWRGWARLLGLDTGYTAAGAPGGLETTLAAPRVDVEA